MNVMTEHNINKYKWGSCLFTWWQQLNIKGADKLYSNKSWMLYPCWTLVCLWWERWKACCEKLIIKGNKWVFIDRMNEARYDFQVITCGKYIWTFGGWGKMKPLNTIEYYDDIIHNFTKSIPMVRKRLVHGAVAFHKNIYVIWGYFLEYVLFTYFLEYWLWQRNLTQQVNNGPL